MKKICLIATLLLSFTIVKAQHTIRPFFDDKGAIRIETQELDESADTLVTVFHRADDIVWSKVVYRVIDLRYKQNFQLYFPVRPDDKQYSNLFKVMLDTIIEGLPIYKKDMKNLTNIKPSFEETISPEEMYMVFVTEADRLMNADIQEDEFYRVNENGQREAINARQTILWYDDIEQKLKFDDFNFEKIAKNQVKYMIQEVIFFDKHYSRLYSKIIAIAPMHPDFIQTQIDEFDEEDGESADKLMMALQESILFWVSFDELRPALAKHYMIPNVNDNHRMTFDEFFAKKLYSSYIIGDSNMYDRMFLDYTKTAEEIRREQQRVFDELLNFEQDLWEY